MTNAQIDIKIMAVVARRDLAVSIADSIGIDKANIVFDDRGIYGGGGAWYNAKRIWKMPTKEFTHRLILQDDIVCCDDFVKYVQICVEKYPESIWTFYNGCWIKNEQKKINTPYLKINGCKTSGQAICLPTSHISRMLEYTDNVLGADFKHDDGRIGLYALMNDVDMMATIPSLSNHLQVKSMIPNHNAGNRFSKTFQQEVSNENWDSDNINETPWLVNDIWLNKKHSRKKYVDTLLNKAREKYLNAKKNKKRK